MQAHDELRHIQQITAHVGNQVDEVEKDQWCYAWGSDVYTAKNYYRFYFRDVSAHKAFKWLWKSSATMKIKVFGWLLLSDRLNTRNMLKRRSYNIGNNYGTTICSWISFYMPPGVCGKKGITNIFEALLPLSAHGQQDSEKTSLSLFIGPRRDIEGL